MIFINMGMVGGGRDIWANVSTSWTLFFFGGDIDDVGDFDIVET